MVIFFYSTTQYLGITVIIPRQNVLPLPTTTTIVSYHKTPQLFLLLTCSDTSSIITLLSVSSGTTFTMPPRTKKKTVPPPPRGMITRHAAGKISSAFNDNHAAPEITTGSTVTINNNDNDNTNKLPNDHKNKNVENADDNKDDSLDTCAGDNMPTVDEQKF